MLSPVTSVYWQSVTCEAVAYKEAVQSHTNSTHYRPIEQLITFIVFDPFVTDDLKMPSTRSM